MRAIVCVCVRGGGGLPSGRRSSGGGIGWRHDPPAMKREGHHGYRVANLALCLSDSLSLSLFVSVSVSVTVSVSVSVSLVLALALPPSFHPSPSPCPFPSLPLPPNFHLSPFPSLALCPFPAPSLSRALSSISTVSTPPSALVCVRERGGVATQRPAKQRRWHWVAAWPSCDEEGGSSRISRRKSGSLSL